MNRVAPRRTRNAACSSRILLAKSLFLDGASKELRNPRQSSLENSEPLGRFITISYNLTRYFMTFIIYLFTPSPPTLDFKIKTKQNKNQLLGSVSPNHGAIIFFPSLSFVGWKVLW